MLHAIEFFLYTGLVLGAIGLVIVDPIGWYSRLRVVIPATQKGLFTPPQAPQIPPSNLPTVKSWHLVRDTSVQKYGPAHVRGVFQGSGGPTAFSDDSKEIFIATQEGLTGLAKVAVTSSGMVLNGYSIASIEFDGNVPYNNMRSVGQKNGIAFISCSTGFNWCVPINVNSTPPVALWHALQNINPQLGFGQDSHACNTDGTWGFCCVDDDPGYVLVFNIQNPVSLSGVIQPSFAIKTSDNWQLPNGSYWCYLDTTNKRMAVGTNAPKTYLIDYSSLYNATPSTPTIVSTLVETFGIPVGNRLYCNTGLTVHTYNISTPSAPVLIGGTSTYVGTITDVSNPTYGLVQYDSTNHLLYLPWGQDISSAGTDVLNINTGTDALTKNQTLPTYTFPDNSIMPTIFATLSPDNTKYAINTAYPLSGTGSIPGLTAVYDVTNVHSTVSPTLLFEVPVQAEPRGAMLANNDTQQFIYNTTRYNMEISDATDTLSGVSQFQTEGLPTQMRRIGVTGGTDPDGKSGPCTSDHYFLMPSGNDNEGYDFIIHCYNGSTDIPYSNSNKIFSDAYWDGKYLWTALNNVGHNGTPVIGLYSVSYSTSATPNTWTFNLMCEWIGAHFVGTSVQSVALCPGTSLDNNNALALLMSAVDLSQGGAVLQYAGGHLVSFKTVAGVVTASEVTTGVFGTGQYGGDPILQQLTDLNSTATFNVQGGGNIAGNATTWFQFAYYAASGLLLGITAIPAGGASNGTNITTNNSEVVISNLPTPPAGAAVVLVGGVYAGGLNQTFNQATMSFAQIVFVNLPATSITINQSQTGWSGNMPGTGNPIATAGNFINMVPEPTNGIMYCACGDIYGVRGYGNLNTTPTVVCDFTTTGDTIPTIVPNVKSSQVAIANQGGKIWLISNTYGQLGDGNGLCIWDVTNGPPSFAATPTIYLKGPSAGFTCGANDTVGPNNAGLVWLAGLSGFEGYQYS